jgi:hypothetical protein
MADLLALIDERIGKLEGRQEKPHLRSLKIRVASAINDPRYHFMFSNNTISDTIIETIAQIFRIPGDDRPICTFQLSGIPSEVVNSVASVLCRMAFELALWSDGAIHMLVVCEEAHRYIPADPNLGFVPTRQAISRIAKEGRKYGVSLGIITQRPGELDQTILSQCSTLFAMRLSNDRDQEIIRSAIPNSSISTMSFLSSIGNGEAIAFGEAIAVPMRMRFTRVQENMLPKAHGLVEKPTEDSPDNVDLRNIVSRMRSVSGPDISSFQQTYVAAISNGYDDEADVEFGYGGHEAQPERPFADEQTAIEPYRPDMLPRVASAAPAFGSQPQTSIDSKLAELRKDLLREDAPLASRSAPVQEPVAPLRREPGTSLRDSILKKPVSSLYNKD